MKPGRTIAVPTLIVVLLAMSLVGVLAAPASALTRCSSTPSFLVNIGGGQFVRVTYDACMNLEKTGAHLYWGDRRTTGATASVFVATETVIVRQCDGSGNNCTTVSATHTPPTSKKVASYGHVYKACASATFVDGTGVSNRCSPFISYP